MKKALRYVAIGDSLTVGYGAAAGRGFVPRYAAAVEERFGRKVDTYNAGVTGATSGEILQTLETDSNVRERIAKAHLITLTAGGNDLLAAAKSFFYDGRSDDLRSALRQYAVNYNKLIGELKRLKKDSRTPYAIRLVDLYNPIPMVSVSSFWIRQFNRQLLKYEDRRTRIAFLYDAFVGHEEEWLYVDHIHPNEKGYAVIAQQVFKSGFEPLL